MPHPMRLVLLAVLLSALGAGLALAPATRCRAAYCPELTCYGQCPGDCVCIQRGGNPGYCASVN